MPAHRRLGGPVIAGLLLVMVSVAACSRFGPHLHVDVDNTDGRKDVTATVETTGPGTTGDEDVVIPVRIGSAWRVPLGSTWEVKIDGRHVIGSEDRTDLALPPGQRQDVVVTIRMRPDGTMRVEACLDEDHVDGRCVAP